MGGVLETRDHRISHTSQFFRSGQGRTNISAQRSPQSPHSASACQLTDASQKACHGACYDLQLANEETESQSPNIQWTGKVILEIRALPPGPERIPPDAGGCTFQLIYNGSQRYMFTQDWQAGGRKGYQ